MSYPYQKVTQTNNPARTPASSEAVQPSGSTYQEIQYAPSPRQVVAVKPASVAHTVGVTTAELKDAQDRYNSAPSSQNPAQYVATVPGDVAGKKGKSRKHSKKSGSRSRSRSRSGSKSRKKDCQIL